MVNLQEIQIIYAYQIAKQVNGVIAWIKNAKFLHLIALMDIMQMMIKINVLCHLIAQ